MKQVSFRVEEEEFIKLNELRGNSSWAKYVLSLSEKSVASSSINEPGDTSSIEYIKQHLLDRMQEKHEIHQEQHDKLHDRLNSLENYHHALLRSIERINNNKPVNFQALKEKKAILNAINASTPSD